MRGAAGEDYPIFYRLGAWEDRPDGIGTVEANQPQRFNKKIELLGSVFWRITGTLEKFQCNRIIQNG